MTDDPARIAKLARAYVYLSDAYTQTPDNKRDAILDAMNETWNAALSLGETDESFTAAIKEARKEIRS